MTTPAHGSFSALVHRALNLAILAGLIVQFYFTGLAIFGVTGFLPHRALGAALILIALLSAVSAAIARLPRTGGNSASPLVLFGLMFLQPVLAMSLRQRAPAFAALHVVNGLALFFIAYQIETRLRLHRPIRPALAPTRDLVRTP